MPIDLSDLHLLALRWGHILAAMIAVGGLFFARFGLLPGLKHLDADAQSKIHDAIRRSWLPWVIAAITLLLSLASKGSMLGSTRPGGSITCHASLVTRHTSHTRRTAANLF